jgi:probable phosphoglycerate mutase
MAAGRPVGGLVVVRHGETEWSENGRHTSRTDLPLIESGRRRATRLAGALDPGGFDRVLCSPLRRARETCELAGFPPERIETVEDLREWDYGDYEGLTTPQIRERRPGWLLWRDGCPDGESPAEVAARADRVLERLVSDGVTIAFAHGHILRVIGARWIELGPEGGARLAYSPGRVGVLGHERETRVIRAWNTDGL